MSPKKYPSLLLGELPVDMLNKTLGTELEAGIVRLSVTAHRHMAEDHPDDYDICMKHLSLAIAEPTYVGQAPHHSENFEMIRRVVGTDGKSMLVAIGLETDGQAAYRVKSAYLIDHKDVEARRQKQRLKIPQK